MLQKSIVHRYLSYAAYLLAFLVLGWGFTPYHDIFLGLILGTIVSFINIFILYFRIERMGQAVVEGKKVRSLGMLHRFAMAGLAVLIVTLFPDYFHMVSMVIGLMAAYLIIFIDSIFKTVHSR